jgi:hypothetical protein
VDSIEMASISFSPDKNGVLILFTSKDISVDKQKETSNINGYFPAEKRLSYGN